jgi:putative toxin-antitoxin system antitoxin component (TIGR02293 family)
MTIVVTENGGGDMSSHAVEDLLGGAEFLGFTIHSNLDLFEAGRKGIPKKALVNLAARLGLSLKLMAELVHVTERTIQRKKDRDLMSQPVSEQALQLAEVYARGEEVFGGEEKMNLWLRQPNRALGGHTPLEILSSRFGAEMALDELGRIEHGVVS